MRLGILVPTAEHVHANFAYSLGQLTAQTVASLPPDEGHDLFTAFEVGTYIHKARTKLLMAALIEGADVVLWLDSDMTFPPDLFLRLLERDEDFVGVNYSTREFPPDFTAVKHVPENENEFGKKLVTNAKSSGLEEVDSLGFGAFLMKTRALKGLPDPDNVPWFWFEQRWPGDHIGEDVYFCNLIRKMCGGKIFADHDLSKLVGHVGSFEYSTVHVEAGRNLKAS